MTMQFGWINAPDQVDKFLPQTRPLAGELTLDEKKDVLLYKHVRDALGTDAPKGPQGIGDCVSWGWSNLVNYIQALQIVMARRNGTPEPEFQEIATEATYGFSRVEVGGQRGSYSDGSVGAWAAEAAKNYGYLSRKYLESKGLPGKYDPKRAKKWGAEGVPDELEPEARLRLIKSVALVTSFAEAATFIQNGYPVAVCSNQGFSMTRDKDGFAAPRGTWNHCMLFMAVRWDRPGLCCSQSWGANTPDGPLALEQPDNSFWVDDRTVDRMLKQRDSFAGGPFDGYISQDFTDWKH
jgi:hypothetical protein